MERKIPVYQAKVGEQDDTGIFAMSFVDFPANETNFVALKRANRVKLNLNRAKQILTGVVLIPNQKIYRNDAQLGEYFLTFTAADIERIAHKMMKHGAALSNTTHQHEGGLDGNYLTEVWTVKDSKYDKSVALGLGEFPVGTLLASYKVSDANYWRNEVLTGNVKGFSLEGFFNFNSIKMNKQKTTAAKAAAQKKPSNNIIGTFLKTVGAMLEGETATETEDLVDVAETDETDSGTPVLIFELADGGEVWVDAEGFATLDGEQMAPGEHALTDGNIIVIDDSGNLVITQEEGDGAEPAATEAELKAARLKGKQFLKAQGDPSKAKIAKLEAELAKLKKQPSTGKAKPPVEGAGAGGKQTFNQKLAATLQAKAERKRNAN